MNTEHTEATPSPHSRLVIIADSRTFMRGCLVSWLNRCARDLQSLATADAVSTVRETSTPLPAAVILSAAPGLPGSAWLNEQAAGVRDALPEVPIIGITDEAAIASGQDLTLSPNFEGLIPMSSTLEIASAALRLVIAGGSYLPRLPASAPRKLNAAALPASQHRSTAAADLTPREWAVCELLTEGLPNKMIARRLGMAVSTVKIHVHHILEKLAVQNRTAVAVRLTGDSQPISRLQSSQPTARRGVAAAPVLVP